MLIQLQSGEKISQCVLTIIQIYLNLCTDNCTKRKCEGGVNLFEKYDYSLLKGKMAEKGYTLKDLAEAMGVTRSSLSRKMNNRTKIGFTQHEMVSIAKILDIDLEMISRYFFTFSVRISELNSKKK